MAESLSNNIKNIPIGVFRYNLGNIWENLSRNVGTFSVNDGTVTPIGFLSNPNYNIDENQAWFVADSAKQKSNTYIGYLNNVINGFTLKNNVEQWRDVTLDRVGSRSIESLDTAFSYLSNSSLTINDSDTHLGEISRHFMGLSMKDAYVANSKKDVLKKGISSDINGYFGINSAVDSGSNIFTKYEIDSDTGRLEYNFHPDSSPIYNKAYANIGLESGKWKNYYQLMYMTNPYTRAYILGSVNSLDLEYELGLTNGTLDINLFKDINLNIDTYISKNNSRFNMFRTYFDVMTNRDINGDSVTTIGYDIDEYDNVWRYRISNLGNKTLDVDNSYEYAESEKDQEKDKYHRHSNMYNNGVAHGRYSSDIGTDNTNDLIYRTNKAFINGKYRTLISRFHSSSDEEKKETEINTAVDVWLNTYGMSHGRNLLRRTHDIDATINTYNDPYCRVWTHHHEYHTLLDAIRPFVTEWKAESNEKKIFNQKELAGTYNGNHTSDDGDDYGDKSSKYHWNLFSSRDAGDNFDTGRVRLGNYGVINQDNGLVNFAPTRNGKINSGSSMFEDDAAKDVPIKKCMFSIENLAWKGKQGKNGFFRLSKEQTGPLGGRIMWFPPYNLTFNETTQANWNQTSFIGRGEPIFTYTDTQRSGNLSFSLLIDHPSVVDYWRLHHNTDNGNGGNYRDLLGDEQTLLRFFAGCEILVPQPFYFDTPPEKPEKPIPNTPNPSVNEKKITFWAFYPNNYSGVDDYPNILSKHNAINAVEYLLNGLGTQMKIVNGTSQKLQDIPTTMTTFKYNGVTVGGYETRKRDDMGISLLTKYHGVFDNREIYKGSTSTGKSLLSGVINDTLATRWVRPNKWYLRKNKLQFKGADISEWYYRVDNSWASQSITEAKLNVKKKIVSVDRSDYLDKKSFGFNTEDGLTDLFKNAVKTGILSQNIVDENINDSNLKGDTIFVSLADMYCFFNSAAKNTLKDGKYGNLYSENRINAIDKAFEHKITRVVINGYASAQGYNNEVNKTLSKNRAKTIKAWLQKSNAKFRDENIKWEVGVYEYPNRVKSGATDALTSNTTSKQIDDIKGTGRYAGDVDDEITKFFRSAHCDIYYSSDVDSTVKDSASTAQKKNSSLVISQSNFNNVVNIDKIDAPYKTLHSDKYISNILVPTSVANGLSQQIKEGNKDAIDKYIEENPSVIVDNDKVKKRLQKILNKKNASNVNYDNIETIKDVDLSKSESLNDVLKRYDMESIFFNRLEINDPVLHNQITDKIKYFDPAFHSITPEGFNARLTFLQQCMRAGQTHSSSDLNGKTYNANNMSFGRPPICVLRVGDFYNTRIVITNLSIKYESWDLNMEGIGVQPMIADIDITFNFIGGSDLAGPISRLQNALSFNYYANTGVYDNRSEMVEYEDGKISKFKGIQYSPPENDANNSDK